MKHLFYFLIILSILYVNHSFAGPGNPHDSLNFDGTGVTIKPVNDARDCPVIVRYVEGDANGTVIHEKIKHICGEPDTVEKIEAGQLMNNDILKIGNEIKTGSNGKVEIEFPDGSIARIGPNSSLTIDQDWCSSYLSKDFMGQIWTKVKKMLGGAKYEVKTGRGCNVGVRGTEFSITSSSDQDIIRVYEGTVELKQDKIDVSNSLSYGEKIKQLNKDLQDGKITQKEFADKVKELTQNSNESVKSDMTQKTSVMVEAGNMCKFTTKLGDPEPIGTNDDRWFDDSNFYKK